MQYYLFDQHLERMPEAMLPLNIRGVRFGEGCFETMCFVNGKIRLGALHLKRLQHSVSELEIQLPALFSIQWLQQLLTQSVDLYQNWRIRVTIYHGGIDFNINPSPAYLSIEIQPYHPPKKEIIVSALYPVQPALYAYGAHKSLNYQLYTYAIQYAARKEVDDVLLVNHQQQIIESSIANVFVVKKGELLTPPLITGCIAGIMRENIIMNFGADEQMITISGLDECEEIFLSNALGIRSVKEWNGKKLAQTKADEIRNSL
jgi:branched-chain amino acid aminotransferase